MFRVEVTSGSAYELAVSLVVFTDRKLHKTIDAGPEWIKQVLDRLDPAFREELFGRKEPLEMDLLCLLISQCPDGPDAEPFLAWLPTLSPGDLYERLAPEQPEQRGLPADLGALRDSFAYLLTRWNEQYFRTVDPVILAGLQESAATKRAQIGVLSPAELVEEATNGIYIESTDLERFILIPHYHARPSNLYFRYRRHGMMLFPADPLSTGIAGEQTALLRLAKALTDENRLQILRFVNQEPRSFSEIAKELDLALSTVHHHLVTLRAAGLVRVHESGLGPTNARYSFRRTALESIGQRMIAIIEG